MLTFLTDAATSEPRGNRMRKSDIIKLAEYFEKNSSLHWSDILESRSNIMTTGTSQIGHLNRDNLFRFRFFLCTTTLFVLLLP